jgi:predicted RNA binding protein YcfA (HicA-like mRNA interferase family)
VGKQKYFERILQSQKNVRFAELEWLVQAFGFVLIRTNGSHCVYKHPRVPELLNLQSVKEQAKPYQINQFLVYVEAYQLTMEEDV